MFVYEIVHVICAFCNGTFQELKDEVVLDEDEVEQVIQVSDDEKLNQVLAEHWAKCTQETPWYDDPNKK